jgi:hypothetical protein
VLGLLVALALLASERSGPTVPASLTGFAFRASATAVHALGGPARLRGAVDWSELRRPGLWQAATGVVRGLLLAVPLLIVFTTLLTSADAVFALRLRELFDVDLSAVASHLLWTIALAWVATGFLRAGALRKGPIAALPARSEAVGLGIVEVGLVLGLLDLLFAGFVWVQLRYLFGGVAWIGSVAGLTYAQYARRGFFELVAVAGLVLPLLLVAQWLLRKQEPLARQLFALLSGLQVVLVLVMLSSALERMRLYREEYGFTELRLYTTAFMFWLGALLVLFLFTVPASRRVVFAQGTLLSAFVAIVALHVYNPDARIVAANREAPHGFDVYYAVGLSADAAPALVEVVDRLPSDVRYALAAHLLRTWGEPEPDWRAWSIARARARDAVAAARLDLQYAAR